MTSKKTSKVVDKRERHTWWSITSYDEIDQERLRDEEHWPDFVVQVLGQMETCPTTGRLHFQGALNTKQRKFGQIKAWLETAHIEVCRQKDALVKYVKKEETSVEGTYYEKTNPRPYYSLEMTMELMGKTYREIDKMKLLHFSQYSGDNFQGLGVIYPFKDTNFWILVRHILKERPYLCSVLSNPQTFRLWVNTYSVWIGEE